MRAAGLVLVLLSLVGWFVTAAYMLLVFRSSAANPPRLADEVSFSLLFAWAGGICFLAGLVLLILDFISRRSRRGNSAPLTTGPQDR